MKKLLLFLLAWPLIGQGAPTIISLLGLFSHCPGTAPAIVIWTGSTFACVALPSNVQLSGTTLTVSAPPATPVWRVETINLSGAALGSTTFSYTPLQTPINGIVLYWYISSNGYFQPPVTGAIAYTGPPLTFTLPIGWLSADQIQIAYQSQ